MSAKPWIVTNLVLPVGDKEYVIKPISYRDGLTLIATHEQDPEKGLPADAPDDVLYRHCMGDVWDQMLEDGCPYPVMERASLAAITFQTALVGGGDCETAVQLAESAWENGLDPEALAAYAAAQREKENQETSKPSTSTGKGAKTRSRASTSGTTSRRATPRTASSTPAKPARSSGRRSSSSGRSS